MTPRSSDLPPAKVQLTDDQWREKLNPEEFAVLRQDGTEPHRGRVPVPGLWCRIVQQQ